MQEEKIRTRLTVSDSSEELFILLQDELRKNADRGMNKREIIFWVVELSITKNGFKWRSPMDGGKDAQREREANHRDGQGLNEWWWWKKKSGSEIWVEGSREVQDDLFCM